MPVPIKYLINSQIMLNPNILFINLITTHTEIMKNRICGRCDVTCNFIYLAIEMSHIPYFDVFVFVEEFFIFYLDFFLFLFYDIIEEISILFCVDELPFFQYPRLIIFNLSNINMPMMIPSLPIRHIRCQFPHQIILIIH